MTTRLRVLICGYGEMGHALTALLQPQHEVRVWTRRPQQLRAPGTLADAATSDAVLLCLPTGAHAEFAPRLAPHLGPHAVALSIAKGLDDKARTAPEILDATLPGTDIAGIYGPMIAEDLLAGRRGYAVAAGDAAALTCALALFAGTPLQLTRGTDLVGASWGAALKNVYAMLVGLADGLALGDNVRGFLLTTATREIATVLGRLRASPDTAYGLAGLGDLITTATSAGSTHHAAGLALARAETPKPCEGVHTLRTLSEHPRFDLTRAPLLQLAAACTAAPPQAGARLTRFLAEGAAGPAPP